MRTPSRRSRILLGLLVLLCLTGVDSPAPAPSEEFTPPADLAEGWYARIETTLGRIVIRLLPEQAPQSVAHFVALAEGRLAWNDPETGQTRNDPYYDGVPVYFAEAGVRFETGDRTGTGRGAPRIYVAPEGAGPVNFFGSYKVGMTRDTGRRISGVQFFVTVAKQPQMTPRYPCFGEVVSGQEVVFAITSVKTYANQRPIEPVLLEQVRILKVGEPAALAELESHTPRPGVFRRRDGGGAARPKTPESEGP